MSGQARAEPVELDDGTLLCGSSTETAGWRVHVERIGRSIRDRNGDIDLETPMVEYRRGRSEMNCRVCAR
jgi:hypothetical protein